MTWQPPSDPRSGDERTDGTGTPTPPAAPEPPPWSTPAPESTPSSGSSSGPSGSGETPSGGPSETPGVPAEPTPYEPSTYEPPPAEPHAPPTSGQTPYAQPQYGQTPYGQPQPTPPQYGQAQYGQAQYPPAGYQTPYQQYPVAPRRTNTMAIVALVCSLGGFVVGVSAPVGAILGHMASRQIAQTGEEGAGMAKAAIIIGWILTGLFVLAVCFFVVAIIVAAASVNT
jgi:hypothetical protein